MDDIYPANEPYPTALFKRSRVYTDVTLNLQPKHQKGSTPKGLRTILALIILSGNVFESDNHTDGRLNVRKSFQPIEIIIIII
jgi:hypothetical protein